MTVFCIFWFRIRRVESALGSQPTIMTFLPASASAATVFCVVVRLADSTLAVDCDLPNHRSSFSSRLMG